MKKKLVMWAKWVVILLVYDFNFSLTSEWETQPPNKDQRTSSK